jgi:hypothetical protein
VSPLLARFCWILAFTSGAALAPPRVPSRVPATEDAILRREEEWRVAQHENRTEALIALLAPEATFTGTSGSLRDRAGYIASRATSALPHAATYDYTGLAVRLYGAAAVVTGRESTTGAGTTFQARFTHVWALHGGQWQLVAVQRTDIAAEKEVSVEAHAKGTFEVTIKPLPGDESAPGSVLGRMSIDKQLHGDIEGTSKGEMLTAMTAVKGSAGYVAIERVTGTLAGRRGTFVLQHTGTMDRGEQKLSITVVPDSGTDELAGLSGAMTIVIAEGKHSYDFAYAMPARK